MWDILGHSVSPHSWECCRPLLVWQCWRGRIREIWPRNGAEMGQVGGEPNCRVRRRRLAGSVPHGSENSTDVREASRGVTKRASPFPSRLSTRRASVTHMLTFRYQGGTGLWHGLRGIGVRLDWFSLHTGARCWWQSDGNASIGRSKQPVGEIMREVQATEAKARFAELLRAVERGETVAITRHGKTVAHMVPALAQGRAGREKAVEEFRRRRASWKRINFTTDEILAARHEGHRQ